MFILYIWILLEVLRAGNESLGSSHIVEISAILPTWLFIPDLYGEIQSQAPPSLDADRNLIDRSNHSGFRCDSEQSVRRPSGVGLLDLVTPLSPDLPDFPASKSMSTSSLAFPHCL
jgi:hypothetical protein